MTSFFISCYYPQICIYVCIYIPKYRLFSPYDFACMSVFRAGGLTLGNQLVCDDMEKATSPASSFTQFTGVFFYYFIFVCVGLCPHWLFSSKFGMFFGAFLYSLKLEQLCLWNFMAVASDVSIRHNITAKSLFLWLLKCFLHPSSIIVPEPAVF